MSMMVYAGPDMKMFNPGACTKVDENSYVPFHSENSGAQLLTVMRDLCYPRGEKRT
jgi:hypothetical protein